MKNLKIGNIVLDGNILLAPMAGFTNVAFRRLAVEHGASLTYTEMVSAKALLYNNQKSLDILKTFEGESPCACQIFGSSPEVIGEAVKLPCLQKFDIIDINMGCPAPKITSNGEGSALLKNIPLARAIIESAVKESNKPITVKFRIGYTDDNIVAVKFAKMCEEAGATLITIHGRTTAQGYSGFSDMDIIRECKESVNIPVIANGDCKCIEDYNRMLEISKADGVMIGRGALGNPEIFSEIKGLKNNISKREIVLKYLEYMEKYFRPKQALLESRAHIMFFFKGQKNATQAKIEIMKAENLKKVKEIVENFFK